MAGLGVPRQQSDWAGQSREFLRGAGSHYGQMMKEEKSVRKTEAPGKTAGGAMMSGASMGLAGASAGATIAKGTQMGASTGGLWGAGLGAVIGLGAYLLS